MEKQNILLRARQYIAAETNPAFRSEVEDLVASGDLEELGDRFYTDLVFGTGGLRGVIGGGSNRMNPYVVRRATQGVANYIRKSSSRENPSAVIAFDSRRFSDAFAKETALVFCGNGIKTYLFTALRPTPELSFAVRHLGATAGVVVTASHNPAEYNGYKVYWSDGGQIVPPHDAGIIAEARSVAEITGMSMEEARERGLL
ncbi:MAG: phospho-sugar mutase, partial [Chitinivibrionales bacterium]|nr:phospho-sugar mutase [Chitinivibrionales bacterium]MBD3394152.1 phospho-sugar mutase [Chitinivibrionales bacterium]